MRILFLLLALGLSLPSFSQTSANKHVIVIGLDGVRRDAFNLMIEQTKKNQETPIFNDTIIGDGILDNAVYAGGEKGTETQQFTFSAPGWVTILTGVWAEHHHIQFNVDVKKEKYNHDYPTIYNYIKHGLPNATTASFTDWEELQIIAGYDYYGNDAADINEYIAAKDENDTFEKRDDRLTKAVVDSINSDNPPVFIYTHYEGTDEAGHDHGFSVDTREYMQSLMQQANYIEQIANAISAAEKKGQQWMIIITTDHGGHKTYHGTQVDDDRDIFAVFQAKDSAYGGGLTVSLPRGQVMFVPTILDYLGIPGTFDKLDGMKFTF